MAPAKVLCQFGGLLFESPESPTPACQSIYIYRQISLPTPPQTADSALRIVFLPGTESSIHPPAEVFTVLGCSLVGS